MYILSLPSSLFSPYQVFPSQSASQSLIEKQIGIGKGWWSSLSYFPNTVYPVYILWLKFSCLSFSNIPEIDKDKQPLVLLELPVVTGEKKVPCFKSTALTSFPGPRINEKEKLNKKRQASLVE